MKKRKANKRPAALFDLDRTITRIDTVVPFVLFYAQKRPGRIPRIIIAVIGALLAFPHIISNDRMKRILSSIFAGEDSASLSALGREFAATAKGLFMPEALAAIAAHREKKHMLVLVSASYEFYLTHIARDLGFDHAVGSVLWRHGTVITGKLYGRNCRGEEKVSRLRMEPFFSEIDRARSYAYGDSASDAPMLSLVHTGIAVNPGRSFKRIAEKRAFSIVRWGGR